MPDSYDIASTKKFNEPMTMDDYQNIIYWFTLGDPYIGLSQKLKPGRLSAFFSVNSWAVVDTYLRDSLKKIVSHYSGPDSGALFLSDWDNIKSMFAIPVSSNSFPVFDEESPPELSSFGYHHLGSEPVPDLEQEQDFDDNNIKLENAFSHSPLKDAILSSFSNDKIFYFAGSALLQSELKADTPCSYKAKGYTHCHNVECKLTVHYWTPGLMVLDVFDGKYYEIDSSLRNEWVLKHCNDLELCKEAGDGYNCHDCSTVSSNGLFKKLYYITGYRCILCYLTSIKKCDVCSNIISIPETGQSAVLDGESKVICKECKSDLKQCSSCGRHFKIKPLFNGYCMSCAPSVIMDYNHKPLPVFYDNPNDDAHNDTVFMGIEVEVEMKEGLQQYSTIVSNRFQEAAGAFVYLKKDSSISKEGFEIVTHPASISYWEGNHTFWNAIRKLTKTCEAWSVDNCGMHVHINRDAFNSNVHMAKFLLFINTNRLLSAFVAERYNAKQAPFLEMDIELAKNIVTFHQKINRHCAVNVQSTIPTIEVRIFKGNLKKQRMLKNIEFVHSVFSFTKTEAPLEVEPYIEYVTTNKVLYPNLCSYISKYKRKL